MGILRELGEGLAQAIYPENLYCMGCGDLLDPEDDGSAARWGLCDKCIRVLFSEDNLKGTLMKDCSDKYYDRALACTVYGGLSKVIIGKFKNQSQPWLGKNIGRLMTERFLEECTAVSGGAVFGAACSPANFVTFVPMHPAKRRIRGYDQAQLLAKTVARELDVPCLDCLERIRQTGAMKNMSAEQRRLNVSGAFAWKDSDRPLTGKHVLLVDDVVTTGSTADACAAVLREHGAGEVTLLAFAAAAHQGRG